ncbi:hypothetical protein YC2023_005770 [Brassica napus]
MTPKRRRLHAPPNRNLYTRRLTASNRHRQEKRNQSRALTEEPSKSELNGSKTPPTPRRQGGGYRVDTIVPHRRDLSDLCRESQTKTHAPRAPARSKSKQR